MASSKLKLGVACNHLNVLVKGSAWLPAEGKTVFIPNLKEWVDPTSGSGTGEKEQELINKLKEVFSQLNKEWR